MIVEVKCGACGSTDLTYKEGKYEWFYCEKCDEMCIAEIVEPNKKEVEQKYYWVCWEETSRFGKEFKSDVISYHPSKLIGKLYKSCGNNVSFTLVNWKEISEEDYKIWS